MYLIGFTTALIKECQYLALIPLEPCGRPLDSHQFAAAIRATSSRYSKQSWQARQTPEAVIRVYDGNRDSRVFSKEIKINEEKNNGRNSNFPGFWSFLAGISTRPGLPNPMPGKICPMS